MSKLVMSLLVVSALLVGYPLTKKGVEAYNSRELTQQLVNEDAKEPVLTKIADLLDTDDKPKTTTVKNTLVLEAKNTVTFRGVVTSQTVEAAMREISKLSRNLSKKEPIYLVLDTPGGSVFDGMDFIDFLEGIPQEVKTVTLFAASMGFQIAENNPGERLIARNGILMSHRGAGGVEGQFNGELESRYRMVKRKLDFLDVTVSKRLGLTYDQYQQKIVNEYWVHGFDSVDQKVADKMVLIQCGETLTGTTDLKIQTFFGPATIQFDKCPLMRDPVSASFDSVRSDAQQYVKSVVNLMFTDRTKFVKDFIVTSKYYNIFN